MCERYRFGRLVVTRALLGALLVLLPLAAASAVDRQPVDSGPGAGIGHQSESPMSGQPERMAEALNEAGESGGFDPFDLIFLCVPGYFLLQVLLTYRTSGGWRKATLAPAVIMAPVLAYTVLAFAAQSNLWPLLMLLITPLAFLYLVVLSVLLLIGRIAKAV